MNTSTSIRHASLVSLALVALGCDNKQPELTASPGSEAPATQATQASPVGSNILGSSAAQNTTRLSPPAAPPKRKVTARPVASVAPKEDDPAKGKFTLKDAVKGLPSGKTLLATIETDLGSLECKLFDDKAPITVANFIGLARGTRPWKAGDGKWQTKKPAYDGTVFHRIIKGFMIQGGDTNFKMPLAADAQLGTGEAGYVIPDEIWEDANHDRPGLLCMANRGPNTNSAQFFITDAAAAHLDNGYTIFGECSPEDVLHKIAAVEVMHDKPKSAPVIKKITITRK